jgi:hypothetical protein
MLNSIKFISPENLDLLSQIYGEIDDQADLHLLSNPRNLGIQDHPDIQLMATSGRTVYNLFDYARRPRQEVLQYMLDNLPTMLDRLLTNTRTKSAGSV